MPHINNKLTQRSELGFIPVDRILAGPLQRTSDRMMNPNRMIGGRNARGGGRMEVSPAKKGGI